MAINQNLIDDLVNIGSSLLNTAMEARHDIKAKARRGLNSVAGQMDLVTRDEFDAAFAMLQKARLMQEEFAQRLSQLEAYVNMPAAKTTKKATTAKKPRLPSVKKAPRAAR